ncbi:MAG: Tfp pilus assembly protein FimT/FimU [Phycisphaeraceae bacterium]
MSRAARPSRGFTLIELVLVMLIIGLLLAIVAPSLGGLLRSQRMDQGARTVAAMLKDARVRAAGEAKPYRLVIDTQDNTAWLEVLTPEGFERLKSHVGKIVELGDKFTIELEGGQEEGDLLYIRVEPDGTADLAQITLTRIDDGEQIAVYCKTPTEPYVVGDPISAQQLEDGADDVELDD